MLAYKVETIVSVSFCLLGLFKYKVYIKQRKSFKNYKVVCDCMGILTLLIFRRKFRLTMLREVRAVVLNRQSLFPGDISNVWKFYWLSFLIDCSGGESAGWRGCARSIYWVVAEEAAQPPTRL